MFVVYGKWMYLSSVGDSETKADLARGGSFIETPKSTDFALNYFHAGCTSGGWSFRPI